MILFYIFVSLLLMFVSGFHFSEYVNTNEDKRKFSSLLFVIVDIVLSVFVMVAVIGQIQFRI